MSYYAGAAASPPRAKRGARERPQAASPFPLSRSRHLRFTDVVVNILAYLNWLRATASRDHEAFVW